MCLPPKLRKVWPVLMPLLCPVLPIKQQLPKPFVLCSLAFNLKKEKQNKTRQKKQNKETNSCHQAFDFENTIALPCCYGTSVNSS